MAGNDGQDGVGRGRMPPTMAIEPFAVTRATGMCVTVPDCGSGVPGIGYCGVEDLGLFA